MRTFLLSLSVKSQLLFIVSSTIILAFLIAYICSLFFDTTQLVANTDLISAVYQAMGTLYAILLTFTLWGIWQNFTEADASAQKEAYSLIDLVHIVEAATTWKIDIRGTVLNYLTLVVTNEWPLLKSLTDNSLNIQQSTHSNALKILLLVQGIVPEGKREAVIYDQALTLLNHWLDARRSRFLVARGNSAKALWPLLFTGAFILFLIHGLFVAKTIAIWIVLLFGTALVIGLTFYLIFTLDCPFTGSPSVDSEPYVLAANILKDKNSCLSITGL